MAERQDGGPADGEGSGESKPVCFIAMPFGRDDEEQDWFLAWYREVIRPAVKDAGFDDHLESAQQEPSAMAREIRKHLAMDLMVVADLGGFTAEDPPNPNVMYELGIRHAFDLPHVIMAWKGQELPFDIRGQRVAIEKRRPVDFEKNRKMLTKFIRAAAGGHYWKPMEEAAYAARVEEVSASLGREDVLAQLVAEVRDSRGEMAELRQGALSLLSGPASALPEPMLPVGSLRRVEWMKVQELDAILRAEGPAPISQGVLEYATDSLLLVIDQLLARRERVGPATIEILGRGIQRLKQQATATPPAPYLRRRRAMPAEKPPPPAESPETEYPRRRRAMPAENPAPPAEAPEGEQ